MLVLCVNLIMDLGNVCVVLCCLLSKMGARVVILSPTRELALQTLKFTKEVCDV